MTELLAFAAGFGAGVGEGVEGGIMKTRYKLHWASGRGPSPELKWQIWDWAIRAPIAHLENRAIARRICTMLNATRGIKDLIGVKEK